jgi:lactoylglutathione lyase
MKVKYTTIAVADMDESIEFYTDIMGLEKYNQFNPYPGLTITFMKGEGEGIIELIENTENSQDPLEKPQKPGLMAMGIEVEDMDTIVKELKSKGAKFTQEPMTIKIGKLAFLEDPNGVRIALVQHQ